MKMLLKRIARKSTYTIGRLYLDGQYFCDTLEDADRDLDWNMSLDEIKEKKVYSKTAIPTGMYKVNMNVISSRFKDRSWAKPWGGKIPRLEDVPGYEGVLIHPGNDDSDTSGCILVGDNKEVGKVLNSVATFNKLMQVLTKAKDITITIQ